MFTGGYGYISTHPFDKSLKQTTAKEHRIWQQMVMRNKLGRLYFNHRYRYEQRWVNTAFLQRARYRIMLQLPLNTKRIERGSLFLTAYDEIFVNINRVKGFDRNRLYAAMGYQINKSASVQLGFLQQTVESYAKGYTQLAFFYNPDIWNKN